MEFEEVCPYRIGDDVRLIDWNVSARYGEPFIKKFREERELTVMLVVDASPSGLFGSGRQFKLDVAAELCAVLAFSAIRSNDNVGLILFTDRVEPGWSSILATVLVLGGVQLLVLWILGEYVGRLYEEAKQRPIYIVRESGASQRGAPSISGSKSETESGVETPVPRESRHAHED